MKTRHYIENVTVLLVSISYMYFFFPSWGNPFIWLFKFIIFLVFGLFGIYFVAKGLEFFFNYVEVRHIEWYRKAVDTSIDSKRLFWRNNVVKASLLFLFGLWIKKWSIFYDVINTFRHQPFVMTSAVGVTLVFVGGMVYIFLL